MGRRTRRTTLRQVTDPSPRRTPCSALLVAWAGAWARGEVGLGEAVAHVQRDDLPHRVTGLAVDDLDLDRALPRLRVAGLTALRVALPAPGDVSALPGPGAFGAAALEAGEAVLGARADLTGLGLVPAVTTHGTPQDGVVRSVVWRCHDLAGPVRDRGPWLADATQELRAAVAAAARELADLDLAAWRPGLADDLDAARAEGHVEEDLPDDTDPRAHDTLRLARRVQHIVDLALRDDGAAVTSREGEARASALRHLAGLARRARQAAYNARPAGSDAAWAVTDTLTVPEDLS